VIAYTHDPNNTPEWGGVYYPVVVCDVCVKPIAKSGNVYWLVQPDGSIHPQVWHTHKWPCSALDDAIKADNRGSLVMSEELGRWLDQLRRNFERLPRMAPK
jgi:hypothetical protein